MSAPVLSTLEDQIQQALRLGAMQEAVQIATAAHLREPEDAATLLRLGQLLLQAGELHEAHQALLKLLQLHPAPDIAISARCELSQACLAAKDPFTAIAWLTDACRLAPHQAALWLQLAQLLTQHLPASQGSAQSRDVLRQGLLANPDEPQLLMALAERLMQVHDYPGALPLYAHLNQLEPHDTATLLNYGYCQEHSHYLHEAAATYRKALTLNPDFMEAHVDLSGLLWRLTDFDGALAHAQHAVAMAPDHPYAVRILGTALLQLGRLDEARQHLQRALQLKPDFAIAQIDLAMLQLLSGDSAAGWRTYQKRWNDTQRLTRPDFYLPANEWQGPLAQPLKGKRILVYGEQGFGDVIQFMRYASCLQAEGAQVFCQIPLPLVPLIERIPGVQCLLPQQLLHTHYHVALMDLPLHFENAIPPAPYLSVAKPQQAAWQARLVPWQNKLKLGIAWAGNPAHANHHNRSLYLSDFQPLMSLDGVQCFSLQKSDGGAYTDCVPDVLALIDLTAHWTDFTDSAAQIAALDLVVCVDSAVAHLAGALGKPVWLLLPPNPDWRWLQAREDTPWYPSLRLFRRAHAETRGQQMCRVVQALGQLRC
ncbi:MAG: tetratricopeptide repeat protein [Burkholderiales bacterium]